MIINSVWKETILGAFDDFQSFRGRNLLALIGIIIGTAAVIAILHVGHNARAMAVKQFEELGTDIIGALIFSNNFQQSISDDEVISIPKKIDNIIEAAAIISTSGEIRIGRQSLNTNVYATTDNLLSLTRTTMKLGRNIYNIDNYSSFVVIGADIEKRISQCQNRPVSLGQLINLNGETFEVIGILNSVPQNNVLRINLNGGVIIPYKSSRRIGQTKLNSIAARMKDSSLDVSTTNELISWIKERDKGSNTSIQTASLIISNIDAQMKIYAFLLLGIGSISLIVSGVGIMNVMLINVLERKHEIGLRRSVGATHADIILLFISNALLLCFIGSLLGLVAGTLIAYIFATVSGWIFSPSLYAIPLGLAMALIVGLFFGIYPAIKASKLDIVTALRSE